MKLALAIVVCVYFCAVSAAIGDLAFQRILAFVKDDPIYEDFPQTIILQSEYQDFLKNNNGHPKFQDFVKNGDMKLRRQTTIEKSINIQKIRKVTNIFLTDKETYNDLRKDYERGETHLPGYQLYDTFFKDVNAQYESFLESAKHLKLTATKYNLLEQPFKEELLKADLDFKLKCILPFRTASRNKPIRAMNNAYAVLEEQLEIFLNDLMKLTIFDGAIKQLKEISKGHDFLRFFGCWFEADSDPVMNAKINEAINSLQLNGGDEHDVMVAKVVVLLNKFREGKNK